ncbi:MAG: ABC transporter ATP-binding protein [Caldilineae bacterium]|nr:ABC transporter ATP-binding protein [Chloroflexota bacterium]MCB9177288.1 ABC transporter ATP-binding protein [Caldilineae bacterium]
MSPSDRIVFDEVSKFYGEVLGVNRVSLAIPPGITSLVGPNGSGKSTLMNLMCGLLQPTVGRIRVLGVAPGDPEQLGRAVGYCSQHDAFPPGLTGLGFVEAFLLAAGFRRDEARRRAWQAIERVGLAEAAKRKVAAYSKGMRQRIKLAQAIAHEPRVLVLDEPLNGLDPMARAEVIALFRDWAGGGRSLIISSHILHEVDMLSDQVVLMNQGYVIAEGDIRGVRGEVTQPMQVMLRCAEPGKLAARLVQLDHVVEVQLHEDGGGLHLRTRDADGFYALLGRIVVEEGLAIETVTPLDDDVHAVYEYLIGGDGDAG